MLDARPNQNVGQTNNNHPSWVVVDDPSGQWGEGSLVDAARNHQLRARGVATLPVVPDYFRASGVGGFFMRKWGAGYPLSQDLPKHHCPVLLYLDPTSRAGMRSTTSVVHWCARVLPSQGAQPRGQLRLAADTGQAAAQHAHVVPGSAAPVDLGRLGPLDERGGWTVGGEVMLNVPLRGHYGFGLYGMGPGLRVAWVSASVTLTSR